MCLCHPHSPASKQTTGHASLGNRLAGALDGALVVDLLSKGKEEKGEDLPDDEGYECQLHHAGMLPIVALARSKDKDKGVVEEKDEAVEEAIPIVQQGQ